MKFFFFISGVFSCCLFFMGFYFPIFLTCLFFIFEFIYLYFLFRSQRIGILIFLIFIIYSLPFIHIFTYLNFDFNSDPLYLWGLAVNPYMLDEEIVKLTGMLGAVGGIGICYGISFNISKIQRNELFNFKSLKTLNLPIWLFWLLVGFYLSMINTPKNSIFTANYTESTSTIEGLNFSSAWMISYIVLTFVFCDLLFDVDWRRKRFKEYIFYPILFIVVVFFQLLRGDRECIPWVMGLILVKFYWKKNLDYKIIDKYLYFKLIISLILIFIITFFVGVLRSSVSGKDLLQIAQLLLEYRDEGILDISNFFSGTWSAVLMTPLSVSGDYVNNLLQFNFGEEYLNLVLSIPPGFFSDFMGFERPIDGLNGPAWLMRYGMGGTHATVVPFMNFSIIGVLIIPFLWAYLINNFEKRVIFESNVINLSFLVSFTMASPHWLWYGEKAAINAVIIWLIFSFFYKVSFSLK